MFSHKINPDAVRTGRLRRGLRRPLADLPVPVRSPRGALRGLLPGGDHRKRGRKQQAARRRRRRRRRRGRCRRRVWSLLRKGRTPPQLGV